MLYANFLLFVQNIALIFENKCLLLGAISCSVQFAVRVFHEFDRHYEVYPAGEEEIWRIERRWVNSLDTVANVLLKNTITKSPKTFSLDHLALHYPLVSFPPSLAAE